MLGLGAPRVVFSAVKRCPTKDLDVFVSCIEKSFFGGIGRRTADEEEKEDGDFSHLESYLFEADAIPVRTEAIFF